MLRGAAMLRLNRTNPARAGGIWGAAGLWLGLFVWVWAGAAAWTAPCLAANIELAIYGNPSFPDSDPDTAPSIGPQTVWIYVKVTGGAGTPWTLTTVALSNLTSGSNSIPASNVSWRAWPANVFLDGSFSTALPTLAGAGVANTNTLGRFDFYLANSWTYNPGSYSATAVYTLATP